MSLPKKISRTIFIIVIIAVAIGLAVLRPWSYFFQIPGIGPSGALTINASSGRAEIYLNGKNAGETPYSTDNIKPGDYDLELKRASQSTEFYESISRKIHIEENTRTLIEAEIGPNSQFSSIKEIYYQKSTKDTPSFYINSTPKGSTVLIDDVRYGETPVTSENLKPGKHTLKISKDGYIEAEVSIVARDGYTLIAEIDLMAIPIEIPTMQ